MSWKFDLRTVLTDLPTACRPVSQSWAMIGLPSDQFALALISNVYVSPSLDVLYVAILGVGSPVFGSWIRIVSYSSVVMRPEDVSFTSTGCIVAMSEMSP
jgi:hypothetical protein